MKRVPLEQVHEVLHRIWQCCEPVYDKDFTSVAEDFLVLDGGLPLPDDEFMRALAEVLRGRGERGAYLMQLEGSPAELEAGAQWELDLEDVANLWDIHEMVPLTEHALVSLTGEWAVIGNHEHAANIGGPREFIAALKRGYPPWQELEASVDSFQRSYAPSRWRATHPAPGA